MYLKTGIKSECTGCSACYSICPKKCIEMRDEGYGFLFPTVSNMSECISCGLCELVCPFTKSYNIEYEPTCFYAWHKDKKVRSESTSGAAFVGIVEICQLLGYTRFYGASYNDNLEVEHIGVNTLLELQALKTSKYVQSALNDTFKEVKNDLKQNKKVVYSGTPCQIDGLINYIREIEHPKLITIALVCHGVASPLCLKKYIEQTEVKNNDNIKAIRFRDKCIVEQELSHRVTTITLKSDNVLQNISNPYTLAFGIGLMHREACFECRYATPYRNADLSIGDFWGIENFKPEFRSEISKGISLILGHTLLGNEIIEYLECNMIISKVPLGFAINPKQQQLSKPMKYNKKRDKFMHKVVIKNADFEKEAMKYIRVWNLQRSVKIRIAKLISKLDNVN